MNNHKDLQDPRPLREVSKFHRLFHLPIVQKPVMPDRDRCDLRINLLEEELKELKQAIEKKDLVEIADALCDLQYVLSGAIFRVWIRK